MLSSHLGPLALGSTIIRLLVGAALIVGMAACASRATPRLQGDRDTAQIDRFGAPATIPGTVEWRFSEPQPDWKPELPRPGSNLVGLGHTEDALRVTLSEGTRLPVPDAILPELDEGIPLAGSVYIDLPDWRREEWAEVVVVARTTSSVTRMHIGLNPRERALPAGAVQGSPYAAFVATFEARGGVTPIVRDGSIHTYRIHLDWGSQRTGPWRRVGFLFEAPEPGSIDILSVHVVPATLERAQRQVTETTLQPPQLKSDFALFRKALEEAHPALYHFTTKREMDAAFARAEAKLTQPMTILQFRNVLAPVLAAIKDGHIGFRNNQGDEISTLLASAKQFPLALKFESMRAFVIVNQGLDERVKPGMEVLAINGKSLEEILQRILPNLPQDGDIRTGQMYKLGFALGCCQRGKPGRAGFSEAYRLYIENPPSFRTTLRDPHTDKITVVDLAGVTNAEAAINAEKNPVNREMLTGIRALLAQDQQQSIRYLDGESTAILIPGFRQNFPDFLEKAFAELKNNGTKNLIVDMRGNGGGPDTWPALLCSYLTSKEFGGNERLHMKTFQPSFRPYTDLAEIDPVTDPYFGSAAGFWKPDPGGGWLMTEKYPSIGVTKPSENHFDGPVYVLIDGGSFSAGSAVCPIADFYKRATYIGEETGGGAEGGTGGGDIGPTLPESLLHFNISMEAAFSVVDKTNRRRGRLPKYEVTQTIEDLAKGSDTVLEFTRELIRSGKR